MNKTILLKLTKKAISDTIGIDGLIPPLLVFGIILRFPIIAMELPTKNKRMKVLAEEKAEYWTIAATQRVLPPSSILFLLQPIESA